MGPDVVITDQPTNAQWSLRTYGGAGDGTWSNYRWEVRVGSGAFQLVSVLPTYTRSFQQGEEYSFDLRATATSHNGSYTEALSVTVRPPSPYPVDDPTCPKTIC